MNKNLKNHQEIGKEQDLYTISEIVGSGLPLFTPKGTTLRRLLQRYIEELLEKHGYEFVWIPHIARKALYEKSGHLEKFAQDMFPEMKTKDREYILKPANCPHHIQIFARKSFSYKDMPQRYAENTTQYRSEQSGELEGLSRVLALTLDDSHVFARKDQIKEEFKKAIEINKQMLKDFNLNYWVRLSAWDPKNKKKYLGDEKVWEEMQDTMEDLLKEMNIDYKRIEGEAAFYGPKMDLMVNDSLGKEWQLSTIQLDFNLPERFDVSYVNEKGERERPMMIHRATFGSYERFLSMIIEHFQGSFPLWLSPVQVAIVPITDKQLEYSNIVADEIKGKGIRVEVYGQAETMQSKIREATLQRVPYIVIIGDKEIEAESVSVRTREGKDLGVMKISKFLELLEDQIDKKI
jgi:threonyl-tRNA synthetase